MVHKGCRIDKTLFSSLFFFSETTLVAGGPPGNPNLIDLISPQGKIRSIRLGLIGHPRLPRLFCLKKQGTNKVHTDSLRTNALDIIGGAFFPGNTPRAHHPIPHSIIRAERKSRAKNKKIRWRRGLIPHGSRGYPAAAGRDICNGCSRDFRQKIVSKTEKTTSFLPHLQKQNNLSSRGFPLKPRPITSMR